MQKKLKLRRAQIYSNVKQMPGGHKSEVLITMSAGGRTYNYIISDEIWQNVSARDVIFDEQLERFKKELLKHGIQGV